MKEVVAGRSGRRPGAVGRDRRSGGRDPHRIHPANRGHPLLRRDAAGSREGSSRIRRDLRQEGPVSTNAADQLRIFSFVNQGFEVIAISPLDEESLKPAIARAKEKGIIVLTSDADAPSSGRSYFVAQALDRDLGYTLLDETVKRVGDTGRIAIVSDSPTIQSMQNWIAAIKERAASTYPGIEIVSIDHTDGTAARAYQFATDATDPHPDQGRSAWPRPPARASPRPSRQPTRSARSSTLPLPSPNTAREYIKSGRCRSPCFWNPADLGYLTVWVGKHLAEGGQIDGP